MGTEEPGRVYFMGAGASKADGFPLTSELKYGICWALRDNPHRFSLLSAYLSFVYGLDDLSIQGAAATWKSPRTDHRGDASATKLPDVTELLSTLDWVIKEDGSFGGDPTFDGDLLEVRDLVVQALCVSLGKYEGPASNPTTTTFMARLSPSDTIITTNWDLLLDGARDERFGAQSCDYGTSGNVVLKNGKLPLVVRPALLKLHGSLSWLYCKRCQRLIIDPHEHIAGERNEDAVCECKAFLSELIVTPGFVREYRNVHLLNVWSEALSRLAATSEWTFIGYSLPFDDIGIRALLIKARCMRNSLGLSAPLVTVVAADSDRGLILDRYRMLLPTATAFPGEFGGYAAM